MNGAEFYTPDFMQFMSLNFQFDPTLRITISEIKASDFYNGEVATKEEIYEEMQRRWDLQKSSKSSSDADMTEADQNVFEKATKAHRGEGDEIDFKSLQVKDYEAGISRGNEFFSTTEPIDLYAILT